MGPHAAPMPLQILSALALVALLAHHLLSPWLEAHCLRQESDEEAARRFRRQAIFGLALIWLVYGPRLLAQRAAGTVWTELEEEHRFPVHLLWALTALAGLIPFVLCLMWSALWDRVLVWWLMRHIPK